MTPADFEAQTQTFRARIAAAKARIRSAVRAGTSTEFARAELLEIDEDLQRLNHEFQAHIAKIDQVDMAEVSDAAPAVVSAINARIRAKLDSVRAPIAYSKPEDDR